MDKELYHPYVNGEGKRVNGAAALNHYMYTVKDGLQEYHDEIGTAYITEFVKSHSAIINAGLAALSRRARIKAV